MSELHGLMQKASRVLHVCRPYDNQRHSGRVQRMRCADCGAAIAVTPAVLADRRQKAHEAGVELAVVCDDCGAAASELAGASILVMPSDEEIRASRRL